MARQPGLLLVVVLGVGLCLALVASASGWLGSVEVCGADQAPGCIGCPAPISAIVWAAFVVATAALLVWHVRSLDR